MKKIILTAILCLVGCTPNNSNDYDRELEWEGWYIEYIQREVRKHSGVIELTFEGETHQYIIYNEGYLAGLTHLPNCKYCKEHNSDIYDGDN